MVGMVNVRHKPGCSGPAPPGKCLEGIAVLVMHSAYWITIWREFWSWVLQLPYQAVMLSEMADWIEAEKKVFCCPVETSDI